MRPAPREIDEGEEAHMARLPGCTKECIATRTWYKRAACYWRVFGNLFSQDDQEIYCRLVEKVGFSPSSHSFSQHPITIGAEKNPSWPALILVQLYFKPWEKFRTTKVGRIFSSEFPSADLHFPLPNGDDYPAAPKKRTAARNDVLKQWGEIMALRSQSRMLFSEPPRPETPVPLPSNIPYPAATPTTVDTPSPPSSTIVSRSFSPVGPQGRHHSSPATSVAVVLPSPCIKASPASSRRFRSRTEDSSLFVKTPRYVPSPLSRPPITLEDDTVAAPSPVDSDDLPLVPRNKRPAKIAQPKTVHEKEPTIRPSRENLNPMTPITANTKHQASRSRRRRRSETPSDDDYDYDFVPSSVEQEVAVDQSPSLSTCTPAPSRGRKRTRDDDTTSSETSRSQHDESMEKRLRSLEGGLSKLEDSHAVRKEELQKQKAKLKKMKRAIAELREEKKLLVVEMKLRAQLEPRRD